ncbi:elongation factor P [Candidatus Kaiserbacteria bacterium CG_4_8_14_3_um_filter_38_9]|uniref:Elongation factor P n=1 Tax=Candidatus Kaiserbacteria bacterium CG_4_8_14_3_um_filter_38_9 TaxID=1974599 RepID=A0A2M7INN6_9BACT|nr:MAG: elongation factor P [Candidatus Kaiserbacteria bacterium CG_4_8_14_3_um_filter_38_9]
MAVLSYSEITQKKVIIFNDEPCLVLSCHIFRKQQRKPVNITKLKGLKSGRVLEQTFHVSETAEEADLENRQVTFIYRKPGEYWFHNTGKPAERFALKEEFIGDQGKYLKDRTEVQALVFNDEIIGIKFPIKVDLKVTEAMPAVKGNTSSSALKEVTLETGVKTMVPMFINEGDIVSINTETGDYSERMEKA